MTGSAATWLALVCAAAAAGLAVPVRARLPAPTPLPAAQVVEGAGWMLRYRLLWALLAGLGAATFVTGTAGQVAGVLAAGGAWVLIGRAEPPSVRRRREDVRRDLPHVVNLFGSALRSGAAPGDAVAVVCAALPGAAAERLSGVAARLALGLDPVRVWATLADDPDLSALGRTMVRAQSTGSPVVTSVDRLAVELARHARSEVEDRARAVGVKAAVPLGLCLLPAFVLIGIVPLVAGLMTTLSL